MSNVNTDADYLLQVILRWPTKRSRDWTRSFVSAAAKDPNIVAVVAIGSTVRPDVSSTDLDLLVVCASLESRPHSPPIEVDLRIYPSLGIEEKLRTGHDLVTWSVRYGRPLYQQEAFWDSIVTSWDYRLPLPSATLARERAARVYSHLTRVLEFGDDIAAREQAISYLTHLVRAELIERGVFPASRPELPKQLRIAGHSELASKLEHLLSNESIQLPEIEEVVRVS